MARLGIGCLAALAALGSCAEERVYVLVTLADVPAGAPMLEVRFRLDGRDALEAERFAAPAGGFEERPTFVVLLPDGASGLFEVSAQALDGEDCPLAIGAGAVTLPERELVVPLAGVTLPCAGRVRLRFPWNGWVASGGTPGPRLIWEALPGATSYEVEADDSCPVSGFAACDFASPELRATLSGDTQLVIETDLPTSLAVPVGSRYTWRVRACAEVGPCSDWSEPRYFDLGREPSDFDGDGLADFVIGAFRQDYAGGMILDGGSAWVFRGQPGQVEPSIALRLDDPTMQPMAELGSYVTSADVNGDGFADALVGAQGHGDPLTLPGSVLVYLGSDAGLTSTPTQIVPSPEPQMRAAFGYQLVAGDVDGDGYADLVVGAPSFDETGAPDLGRAYWFRGGAAGIVPAPAGTLAYPIPRDHDAHLGAALSLAGDFDGDGFVDLAVGARGATDTTLRPAGAVLVYPGSPGGLAATPAYLLASPAPEPGAAFGNAIGAGDVDGDGFADLVVGAYAHGANDTGRAYVHHGSPDGLERTASVELPSPSGDALAAFGYGVVVADLDGDGLADPIVGAYGHLANQGAVYVYRGDPIAIDVAPWWEIQNPFLMAGGVFGFAVGSPGDLDGDGYADLIVGAHGTNFAVGDDGAAFVFYGGPQGVGPVVHELGNPEPQTSAFFGIAVTSRP